MGDGVHQHSLSSDCLSLAGDRTSVQSGEPERYLQAAAESTTPSPGQAAPPQHPRSQALPPPSLRRQPGSLLLQKSHVLPGNRPLFFSLCCTAVLTKIRTCRVMPLVSGSSEENAAMPVSSQQGERLLEKRQETRSQQEQHPQRPPTSSPLPTTTDSPAFPCSRTAGQPPQLRWELSLEPCEAQSVPLLARIEGGAESVSTAMAGFLYWCFPFPRRQKENYFTK